MKEQVRRLKSLINAIENDCITQEDIDEVKELMELLKPSTKVHL